MIDPQIDYVLKQRHIPVAFRMGAGRKLVVRIPFAEGNMAWLQAGRRNRPKWIRERQEWEIPQAWFNSFVDNCLRRYRRVYVIQPHRELEKCAPACMDAEGHECQCSCLGANHGSKGGAGWFAVNEAFAFRWGASSLACRLMTPK
ncbi:hypothetical protein DXM27_06150 [Rhizobium rhizogenes]|uniref:Uncharacterized protein n=1 Tax=Rhizobium rhizogenes TaxID=359 RepID=A0AA88F0G9_RHIRH|nr:hypothetical protein DXM27_06150 [Rhizobium rhizogenes]